MTIKIENIVEFTDFRTPNQRVAMLEVHYVTDKNYRGVVTVEKIGSTKETITAAVKEAAAVPDGLIGTSISGK